MNEETNKRKYSDLLGQLLRSIEQRDGRAAETIAEPYMPLIKEGMDRESIIQILADEPAEVRGQWLLDHPELIAPYAYRIKFE